MTIVCQPDKPLDRSSDVSSKARRRARELRYLPLRGWPHAASHTGHITKYRWVSHAMDLTNEDVPKPPPVPPTPVPTQTLHVTPDNVVELGVLFRRAADLLGIQAMTLDGDLRLDEPWLGDPVSGWIWQFFNSYFVDAENSFTKVVQGAYEQHKANAEALTMAAEQYGLRDELDAEWLKRRAGR